VLTATCARHRTRQASELRERVEEVRRLACQWPGARQNRGRSNMNDRSGENGRVSATGSSRMKCAIIASPGRPMQMQCWKRSSRSCMTPREAASKSRSCGPHGAPVEMLLRLLLLKHIGNSRDETLEREVRANLVYQVGGSRFLRAERKCSPRIPDHRSHHCASAPLCIGWVPIGGAKMRRSGVRVPA
jgi:hypothetical protein